jgi:tape measure domain-containing protein
MARKDADALLLQVSADIRGLEKQFAKAIGTVDGGSKKMEDRAWKFSKNFAAANDNIVKSLNPEKLRAGLLSTAAAFGAAFSVREVQAITDAYIRFTNSLKVAGVEGAALGQVQSALFASAQRNGVELEALGTLYGRASQAAKSLGATQTDLLKFTDGVTNALRIQGGDPAAASGALLQLSQALQAGTVRAEEFNSVNEGAFPILQAVAAGMDRAGGSVAKLRAEVLAGKVTSQEFFQAFLKGSASLEERAAKSTLTSAQALTQLRNALVQYVGGSDQAAGASAAMASGIKALADNIDVIIPAIAVLGVALGVGFVANAARAQLAAGGVGRALLGAFGGPVGLAITAISIGVASLAGEAATAQRQIASLEGTTSDLKGTLADARALLDPTPGKLASVGQQAAGAVPGIQAFAGEVGNAAGKLWELAAAQKAAAINKLMGERAGLSKQIEAAEQRLPQQRRAAFASDFGFGNHGSLSDQFGRARRFAAGEIANIWTGGKSDQEAADAVAAAKARMKEVEEGIIALGNADLKQFADEAKAVQAATGGGAGKPKKAGSAKAAVGRQGFAIDPVTVDQDTVFDLNNSLTGRPREVDSSPIGFQASGDRIAEVSEQLKALQDQQYQGIYTATYGALDAAFRGGAKGVLSYFAQQLEQQALQGIASGIAKGLSQKAGAGLANAAMALFGFAEGGYLGGFANGGGLLTGPGTGTSDSIMATNGKGKFARFSNGEFVVNAAATRRNRDLLEAINSGRIGRYAAGGLLGGPGLLSGLTQSGGPVVQQFFPNFSGAVMTEDLLKQFKDYADGRADQAALQGAQGGAALARQQIQKSATNRLGGRRR